MDSVYITHVRHHTHLALCTCCVCFAKNRMMMCQPFSRIHIFVLLLCWREAAFSTKWFPPPPFFHPDCFEFWCLRHTMP